MESGKNARTLSTGRLSLGRESEGTAQVKEAQGSGGVRAAWVRDVFGWKASYGER